MIDPELLEVLGCPRCSDRPPLIDKGETLVCSICGWAYSVQNGIPNMLADEALPPAEPSLNNGDNFERT